MQTSDQYWSQTNNGLNCLLAGPVAPSQPWTFSTSEVCQGNIQTAALADLTGKTYGLVQFFLDYQSTLHVTIAIDGEAGSQLLYQFTDLTQSVRLHVNDYYKPLTGGLAYQYSFWPFLQSSAPYTCMTLQVPLKTICNPATSTYSPSPLTLAPVQNGGNYGCLCTSGRRALPSALPSTWRRPAS